MSLPAMIDQPAVGRILPPLGFPHVHRCTLDELGQRFVAEAPRFDEARNELLDILEIYIRQVRRIFPEATFWINGGFTTHKTWAAPEDVDVVIWVSPKSYGKYMRDQETHAKVAPLLTLQGVAAQAPLSRLDRMQPFGGLIDSFLPAPTHASRAYWHEMWSKLKDGQGQEVVGAWKGFVEVTL